MGTELQLMVHLKTMVDPSCTVSKSFLQLPSNEETNCNRSPSPKRGKSPLRAYPPMKLLDFNGHRDILFEARTKYSEMREGKVLMIQSARMFVFTDCFGIALLTGDSQVPYKVIYVAQSKFCALILLLLTVVYTYAALSLGRLRAIHLPVCGKRKA